MAQRTLPVGIGGEPSSVHEHGERRPVGQIMTEEVVEKKVVGRLLRAVVMTGIDHGADGRRLLFVVIVNHGDFPKTRVGIRRAGSDLAFLH